MFELHLKLCRGCSQYLKEYEHSIDLYKQNIKLTECSDREIPEELVKVIMESKQGN